MARVPTLHSVEPNSVLRPVASLDKFNLQCSS